MPNDNRKITVPERKNLLRRKFYRRSNVSHNSEAVVNPTSTYTVIFYIFCNFYLHFYCNNFVSSHLVWVRVSLVVRNMPNYSSAAEVLFRTFHREIFRHSMCGRGWLSGDCRCGRSLVRLHL